MFASVVVALPELVSSLQELALAGIVSRATRFLAESYFRFQERPPNFRHLELASVAVEFALVVEFVSAVEFALVVVFPSAAFATLRRSLAELDFRFPGRSTNLRHSNFRHLESRCAYCSCANRWF